jgi:hypothetical protein
MRRGWAALGTAAVLVFSGAAAPGSVSTSKPPICPRWVLIGLRGSGEAADEGTRNLGATLYSMYVAIADAANFLPADPPAAVAAEGVRFPVTSDVESLLNSARHRRIPRGIRQGVSRLQTRVAGYLRSCPNASITLAGYQDGAWAVGEYLRKADRRAVGNLSAVLFSDPMFDPSYSKVYGDFDHSLKGVAADTLGPRKQYLPKGLTDGGSICLAQDPVCNWSGVTTGSRLYWKTPVGGPTWADLAGQTVGTLIAPVTQEAPRPPVPSSRSARIRGIASSVRAALAMTPDDLAAWVTTEYPDASSNRLTWHGFEPFGFPVPMVGTDPTDRNFYIDADTVPRPPTMLEFSSLPGRRFPVAPNVSLLEFHLDEGLWRTLVFLNGSVTIPLDDERAGKATVSFGTQIWPDGKTVTLIWISNLDLPNNPNLGPNQIGFTDCPAYGATTSKTEVATNSFRPRARRAFLAQLDENVGNPIRVDIASNNELQVYSSISAECAANPELVDARISGVEVNQFASIYRTVGQAYFDQDPAAFDAAIARGEEAGIFLTGSTFANLDAKDGVQRLQARIRQQLGSISNLKTAFAHLPLGIGVMFLPGALGPPALVQGGTAVDRR